MLSNKCDEPEADTSTTLISGLRKSPRSCITTRMGTSGVSRTEQGSRRTKASFGYDGSASSSVRLLSLDHIHRWKLLLGPTEPPQALKDQMSKELPKGKTVIDLFSDFMSYLFDSTKSLFISSNEIGELQWNSVSRNIELVLTHPNGWGGPQQSNLRAAAVQAGIVPDTAQGRARVHFVTEGEASFNFCVTHTLAGENLKVWISWRDLLSLFLTFQ